MSDKIKTALDMVAESRPVMNTLTRDQRDELESAARKMVGATSSLTVKLHAWLSESKRLEKLTARELVNETLKSAAADYSVVVELMNRVLPGWQDTEDYLLHTRPLEKVERNPCNARKPNPCPP